MKKGTYVALILLFFALLAAAGLFSLFVLELGRPRADVPARAYLDITLSGPVAETAPSDVFSAFFPGRPPLALHDLWMNLRKARNDGRIQAVLLRLGFLQCDWAKAAEMRDAVLEFRRSGKPVYAYIEEGPDFDKEYFIATACDRIILHPLGWLGVNGIGGHVPFFKRALDKLGVKAEFEHVEEYKTAYNIFTEKGFTAPHREEMESLYEDLFDQYLEAVAEARRKSRDEVRALVDRGFYQGERAKEAGLVDDCLYEDEVRDLLREDGRELARVRSGAYVRVKPSAVGLERGRKVALIYATGMIMTGESLPQVMGGTTMARWVRTAREDASIKAIVLRVDSPGGSSVGSDVVWREVELARRTKPVVVSMSDVAGSGGYWISMAATRIVAQPQTLTGSIGVLAGKFSVEGLADKLGITSEKLAYGEKADIFSPFRPFTPEERRMLKDEILWTYDRFLEKAAAGRGLTKDDVDKAGRGRVWTGRQALDLKLVDELGGLSTALDLAKQEAGIPPGEEVRLVIWPKKRSVWQSLFGRPELGLDLKGVKGAAMIERALETFRLMDRTRIWAVMPLWPEPR
jgi:protease IV